MLRAIMAEIIPLIPAEHHTIGFQQPSGTDFFLTGPARRTIGGDIFRLARPPHRQADGDDDRSNTAGRGDNAALDEDRRSIGVKGIPPPIKDRRPINRNTHQFEPGWTKLRLIAEPPCRPLGRAPGCGQHDQKNDENLTPEDTGGGHDGLRLPEETGLIRRYAGSCITRGKSTNRANG